MKELKTLLESGGTAKELLEARASVKEQMHDIVRNAENEGRQGMNPEEAGRFEQFDGDFNKLTELWQTQKKAEEMQAIEAERQAKENPALNAKPVLTKEEKDKAYKKAYWKYMAQGMGELTHDEQAILRSRRAEIRGTSTQVTTTTTLGGFLVPQDFSEELEKRMKFFGGMLEACRIIRTVNGETIDWPTIDDTGTTGNLTSEASPSISVADLTFGQKQLEAYTYDSGIIKVSVQLMQDSFFNLEDEIQGFFAERLGRKVNADLTTGDGSSKPNGIITAVNAVPGTVNAADDVTIARTDLNTLVHNLDRAYRVNAAFMLNDGILKEIKALSFGSADDRPLWQTSMREGEPDRLEGYPYFINNDMAASLAADARTVLFGDFSKYVIRIVQDMVLVPLRELYMASLQVGFISYMRVDGELIQDNAVKVLRQTNT